MGASSAARLRQAGIDTVEELLKEAGAKSGRSRIAKITGIDESTILEWVNRADLMRIKGIGSEYSDLLSAVGVDTARELARRNAAHLASRLAEVNDAERLVRRTPTLPEVAAWIVQAASLATPNGTAQSLDPLHAEILDFYGTSPEEPEADRLARILSLEGSLSEEDGERMLAHVRELRGSWR